MGTVFGIPGATFIVLLLVVGTFLPVAFLIYMNTRGKK